MTMNKNYNKIIKGVHAYSSAQVTFSNGKKNEVHLYPRSYVNLVNRYLNLGKNKKNKINVYKINRASIVNWGGRSASNVNTILGNRYIMHKFWRKWLNSNFGLKSRIFQNELMSKSKLSQFMEKMRNPYKATFNENKGTYVQATPGQLAASKTMARIREGRNKELARELAHKWLNITRIRKQYPFPVKGNNKWPAY